MELRHLRYFVTLAELLHFGRAAARLKIAQPSLSHQIRQLESDLQTTLLRRTKRRVELTEAGDVFLKEAREILARADRAAMIARRAGHGETGVLRVAAAFWMDPTPIAAAIKTFSARHPAIRVELKTLAAPPQIEALLGSRLDVGLVRPPAREDPLEAETLIKEPFIVALPARHRLAGARQVELSSLADEPFVFVPRDCVPRFYDLVLDVCRAAGFVPHAPHDADHPSLVLAFVAAGIGISLVPNSCRKHAHPGASCFATSALRRLWSRPQSHGGATPLPWSRSLSLQPSPP